MVAQMSGRRSPLRAVCWSAIVIYWAWCDVVGNVGLAWSIGWSTETLTALALVLVRDAGLALLLVHILERLPTTPWRYVALCAVALNSAFTALSVISHRLSGALLNWPTLRGDEGVTLHDVTMLPLPEVALGVSVFVGSQAIWLARPWRLRAAPAPVAAVALAMTIITGGLRLANGDYRALGAWPAYEFVRSMTPATDEAKPQTGATTYSALHAPILPRAAADVMSPRRLPRNVILYLAEGTPTRYTSLGNQFDSTPALMRWMQRGSLHFDAFYANYHKSMHMIFTVLCSQYPPAEAKHISITKPRIDCGSFVEPMAEAGVRAGLFHGGFFSFSDKLRFLGGRGFERTVDAAQLSKPGRFESKWGVDDRAVVDAALSWMQSLGAEDRFFAMIIPIAPHHPFDFPSDVDTQPFRSDRERKYLSAVQFADVTFDRLMTGLEAAGRLKDTMVLFAPDHGQHFVESNKKPRPTAGTRMLYQDNVHVPMVALYPGGFDGAHTSHRLGSHVDTGPTILGLLDVPPQPQHVGQDLFGADFEARKIYLSKYRGRDEFIGIVDGPRKLIFELRDARAELYDLRTDPEEYHNLTDTEALDLEPYMQAARQYRAKQRSLLSRFGTLGDDRVEPEDLIERASFELTAPKRSPCQRQGPSITCGRGPERFPVTSVDRRPDRNASTKRALALPLPTGAAIEIRYDAADFGLSSNVRVVIPSRDRGGFDAEMFVDGKALKGRETFDRIAFNIPHHSGPNPVVIRLRNKRSATLRFLLTLVE